MTDLEAQGSWARPIQNPAGDSREESGPTAKSRCRLDVETVLPRSSPFPRGRAAANEATPAFLTKID